MMTDGLKAPSIILEWETVKDAGVSRAKLCLEQICIQTAELRERFSLVPEVLIAFEEGDISPEDLQMVIADAAQNVGWNVPVSLIAVPSNTPYYQKKNLAALEAENELFLFMDTDVVPEQGWLLNMLMPFEDWRVSVLIGATHLDHATPYEMAIALTWIFDPATYGQGLQPIRRYSSNNLCFRRAVFLKFPFAIHDTYRGPCAHQQKTLLKAGIMLPEQTDARSSHPPPAWPLGFVHRAWMAGKDEYFYRESHQSLLEESWNLLLRDFRVVSQRIRERNPLLKPTFFETVLAHVLGRTYYAVKAISFFTAHTKNNSTLWRRVLLGS